MYDCDCGSLCNLYACGSFLVVDLLYVCVCVLRKTTLNLLIVTQRTGRMPSVRNCRTSVCTSCDSSCLFVFLPYMSSDIFYFFFSLPIFLSVITLKSCTVLLSRSELLQNCSAIRNCEFLNKTFFFVVFHLVFGFYCG